MSIDRTPAAQRDRGEAEPVEASYFRLRPLPDGETVHRTASIAGDKILIDIDAEGRIIGIECLTGPVGVDVMAAVLSWAQAPLLGPGHWTVQYGHDTTAGFVPEPRGRHYAISERDVWSGPSRPVDHKRERAELDKIRARMFAAAGVEPPPEQAP